MRQQIGNERGVFNPRPTCQPSVFIFVAKMGSEIIAAYH